MFVTSALKICICTGASVLWCWIASILAPTVHANDGQLIVLLWLAFLVMPGVVWIAMAKAVRLI